MFVEGKQSQPDVGTKKYTETQSLFRIGLLNTRSGNKR